MRSSRLLIFLASLLVPAGVRADWSREWAAELHHIDSRGGGRGRLLGFARGAFLDALWHRRSHWNREAVAAKAQSPWFCLAGLAAVVVAISAMSGGLPITRTLVTPLPYRDADRIAIVTQGGSALATRSGVRGASVALWQSGSKLVDGAAAYSWKHSIGRASDNFFPLLGARANDGRTFDRERFAGCGDCVVISYDLWRRQFSGRALTPADAVTLGGRRYRVAGVLEKRFWFLSRDISYWIVAPLASFADQKTGVVVRLHPGVGSSEAERELTSILQHASEGNPWNSLVRVMPVLPRVRSVFGSFGLALSLAAVIAAAGSRVRVPRWKLRATLFFAVKTQLLILAVLLAGIEFTHAAFITELGGGDWLTEPLSTWLFLMASMAVLVWSVRDQQARCRVCLRRLGLPMRIGCPGCLLLDWAGTELVCMEGHGMLHVPEMATSWEDPERWTALDESWQGLFERG